MKTYTPTGSVVSLFLLLLTGCLSDTTVVERLHSHPMTDPDPCELWQIDNGIATPTKGCTAQANPQRSWSAELYRPRAYRDDRWIHTTCPLAMAGSC